MDWKEYKQKAKLAIEDGDLDTAEQTLQDALVFLKDTEDSDERACLCLDQLGWIYVKIDDLEKAEASYKESLGIKLRVLGKDNPIVARACKKLATVVYLQDKFDLAERYSKEALNIFTSTLGSESKETLETLKDLVSLLRKLGRNIEAKILEKSVAGSETASTPDAPLVEVERSAYEQAQSIIRIKVCKNCNLAYDGDRCMRCSVDYPDEPDL